MRRKKTNMSDPRTIRLEEFLPHPPERVWRALTTPELIARWLMPNNFQLEIGHPFTFKTQPIPAANFDGIIHCRVVEVEPEQRLKISWGEGSLDTTVTWQLIAEDTGTRLLLEHDGFDPNNPIHKIARDGMGNGWRTGVLPSLAKLLDAELAAEKS
jgi:uncharacterized protein YndB with AHSA1/START domain